MIGVGSASGSIPGRRVGESGSNPGPGENFYLKVNCNLRDVLFIPEIAGPLLPYLLQCTFKPLFTVRPQYHKQQ